MPTDGTSPENVRRCLASNLADGATRAVEIQTHHGNHILGVSEIWDDNGALRISVFALPVPQ